MKLQTDPTVIYGMGDKFDGNLRKIDLQTDHAYNTYTDLVYRLLLLPCQGWLLFRQLLTRLPPMNFTLLPEEMEPLTFHLRSKNITVLS